MKSDVVHKLKMLGKQAKAARLQQEEVRQASRRVGEEAVDFAAAVGAVTPLKNRNQYQHPSDKSPIKPRRPEAEDWDVADGFFVGDALTDEPPAVFCKNGRGQGDIRRLQAKHWPIVGHVDLHGYKQEEAQEVLNAFVDYVQKRGVCGEIVHGSGLGSKDFAPVLKNTVRRWLMAHPEVLAYAQPHKNNDGAVLILLRQHPHRRKER